MCRFVDVWICMFMCIFIPPGHAWAALARAPSPHDFWQAARPSIFVHTRIPNDLNPKPETRNRKPSTLNHCLLLCFVCFCFVYRPRDRAPPGLAGSARLRDPSAHVGNRRQRTSPLRAHPVRVPRVRLPRFAPRVGLPRHPFC